MREKLIEDDGVRYATDRGWTVYKWASPGVRGVHDRIFFKAGVTFTIEYKSTGQHATPKQREVAKRLKRANVPCRCCDSVQTSRAFIDVMNGVANDEDPIFDMIMLSADLESFE